MLKNDKEAGQFVMVGFAPWQISHDETFELTSKLAEWLERPDLLPPARKGTWVAYRAFTRVQQAACEQAAITGRQVPPELAARCPAFGFSLPVAAQGATDSDAP